jgi:hypothetical protein
MINKQRVQRFRTLIYTVIVLLILVPIVLLIALSIRMIGMIGEMEAYLASSPETSRVETVEPAGSSAPVSEGQSFSNPTDAEVQPESVPATVPSEPVLDDEQSAGEDSPAQDDETDHEALIEPENDTAAPVPTGDPSSGTAGQFAGLDNIPLTGV